MQFLDLVLFLLDLLASTQFLTFIRDTLISNFQAPDSITMPPTKNPTREPTTSPTLNPTFAPTITKMPTVPPTSAPTFGPTVSKMPTQYPTKDPTTFPKNTLTMDPTSPPTRSPWYPNPNPQCGTQADGALCSQSLFCCNSSGYCGLGTRYCGEGCQSGMFCANPTPAPVEEDAAPAIEQVDAEVVDIAVGADEADLAEPGHSFSVIGSGGMDSINEESSSSGSVECGERAEYIKNGIVKTKVCASNSFNARNLCHRQLAKGAGRVWDVCCDQCEELKNAAR